MPIQYFFNPIPLSGTEITAFAYAQANAAQAYIVQLGEVADDLTPPTIDPIFPDIDAAPTPIETTPPDLVPVVWQMPGLPTPFTGTLDIGDYIPDAFDEDPPTLVFGSPPTLVTDPLPTAPDVNLVYDDPVLDISLPAAPDLLSLSVSTFNGVTIPTIDFTIPELNVVSPSITEYVPGDLYTSALLVALQTAYKARIEDGGTGLNSDVENAIWDRGRDREVRQAADAVRDLDSMEALGYALPSGVYVDARIKIQTEMGYNASNISREIMIAQAELEQKNVMHALDGATTLEGQLISYNNQVEQRLFEAARYATEAGISVYNANVQAYTAFVDAYKAKVVIYEAQVRAEMTKVEVYKAEIEAELAKAQINNALVEQYRVAVDAALSGIRVFEAEIAAIQSKADIERLKVMIFGEQVKGYTAQVNAYTAGVEGFRATVQAEGAKQEAFTAQVRAYSAEVDAGSKVVQSRIDEYLGRLKAKELEWEGYKSASAAEASRADAISSFNQSQSAAYRAEVAAISAYNEAVTKQWQAALDQAQRVVEIGVSAAKANAELYITTRSLALDAAKVGAQVSAQLGASALSALSLSNSFNVSNAASASISESDSTSESVNTNHNYSYSV